MVRAGMLPPFWYAISPGNVDVVCIAAATSWRGFRDIETQKRFNVNFIDKLKK